MTQHELITHTDSICCTLNQRRYQDGSLFCVGEMPVFWKLSELAFSYSYAFDMAQPMSSKDIYDMKKLILTRVPELQTLTPEPIHVLNVKESYAIKNKDTKQVEIVKNGQNQNLSRVAAEYMCARQSNTKIHQAYFLALDKTVPEIADIAKDLHVEYFRSKVAESSKKLSSIINRANGAKPYSFQEIWALIWCTFYDACNMETLRTRYGIKGSPVDYMTPSALHITNQMLTEIIKKWATCASSNIATVAQIAKQQAIRSRNDFIAHGYGFKAELFNESTHNRIEKIHRMRDRFWQKNYPQSLQK